MATGRSQKARKKKAGTWQQSAAKQKAANQIAAAIGSKYVHQALHTKNNSFS